MVVITFLVVFMSVCANNVLVLSMILILYADCVT